MMEKEINHGEEVLKFIKSLPQVKGRWDNEELEIEYKYAKWQVYFNMFGCKWTYIELGNVIEYKAYDHTDLEGVLKEIYTLIEANKEDIIKAFTVDNSSKIANLKEQIDRLNNELKHLEDGS